MGQPSAGLLVFVGAAHEQGGTIRWHCHLRQEFPPLWDVVRVAMREPGGDGGVDIRGNQRKFDVPSAPGSAT